MKKVLALILALALVSVSVMVLGENSKTTGDVTVITTPTDVTTPADTQPQPEPQPEPQPQPQPAPADTNQGKANTNNNVNRVQIPQAEEEEEVEEIIVVSEPDYPEIVKEILGEFQTKVVAEVMVTLPDLDLSEDAELTELVVAEFKNIKNNQFRIMPTSVLQVEEDQVVRVFAGFIGEDTKAVSEVEWEEFLPVEMNEDGSLTVTLTDDQIVKVNDADYVMIAIFVDNQAAGEGAIVE